MSVSPLILLGIAFIVYALLPTLLGRLFSSGSFARDPYKSGQLSLTFDDGPDPLYTPLLLDLLKERNIKATFFLVGKHAEKYPELVLRIHTEGHSIGSHGYKHHFSCLVGPLNSLKDINKGNEILESITGQRPAYYRPAWGVFNLFTLPYLWFSRQKVVLWSIMSWDWCPLFKPSTLTAYVNRKLKPGAVIIFHDRCTKPVAAQNGPQNLLLALPQILDEIKNRQLIPVNLEEFYKVNKTPVFKIVLLKFWRAWELCFEKLAGLKAVGEENNSLFRLAVRCYRGKAMQLPDGTFIKPGDKVGELHLNNDLLHSLSSDNGSIESLAVRMLRETKRSLPLLASVVHQDPAYQGIKALIGITLIHRGTTRLGFSVYDLSPWIESVVAWYQRWLLFLLHPGGLSHLRRQWHKLVPKKVVISKDDLINRYLPEAANWPDNSNINPARGSINAR